MKFLSKHHHPTITWIISELGDQPWKFMVQIQVFQIEMSEQHIRLGFQGFSFCRKKKLYKFMRLEKKTIIFSFFFGFFVFVFLGILVVFDFAGRIGMRLVLVFRVFVFAFARVFPLGFCRNWSEVRSKSVQRQNDRSGQAFLVIFARFAVPPWENEINTGKGLKMTKFCEYAANVVV